MEKKASYSDMEKYNPNKQIDINNVILSEFEFLEIIGVGINIHIIKNFLFKNVLF